MQTNKDGLNFCVDPRLGAILLQPSSKVKSCDCVVAAASGVMDLSRRKERYTPQCDKITGQYMSKQCDAYGTCWCSDGNGMQLGPKYGPRVRNSLINSLNEEIRASGPQPRASCDLVRKYWEKNNM